MHIFAFVPASFYLLPCSDGCWVLKVLVFSVPIGERKTNQICPKLI